MKNKVDVFDIETNQEFALELDGDLVVVFKPSHNEKKKKNYEG